MYDGSFIQSSYPWNAKCVLQTFHFNLHKSPWRTYIWWQCCCCCQVSPGARWAQVLLLFQTWWAYCWRPTAVLAILTMRVRGGILLGTLVLIGFFVSEKTDALKDDSSRLHQWLFQWLQSCLHSGFFIWCGFFCSCQHFFVLRIHARLKRELPVCFPNRSHLKNRTHLMQFTISQGCMKQQESALVFFEQRATRKINRT